MFQKFGKSIPQSLVDAVSGIMSEAKADDLPPIDKDAAAARKARQARLDAIEDAKAEKDAGEKSSEKPTVRKVAGSAYGGAKQKDDIEEACDCDTKKEELVGGQKKLDKNKNGKLDSDDFKKLRAEDVEQVDEVLTKKTPLKTWIHDFVHSKNSKFSGKSTKERSKMAQGAYYGKQDEETEIVDEAKDTVTKDASGKVTSWSHEGDWKKSTAKKNPKGIAPHLSDLARRKTIKMTKETMMGKAGCTSEEAEIEESRGHKIIANKLAQIDRMSSGVAPDHSTNVQSTKDKLKDSNNIGKVEIVTQKDTTISGTDNEADQMETKHKLNKMSHGYGNVVHKEEVVNELTKKTLSSYIKKASSSSDERSASNLASKAAAKLAADDGKDDGEKDDMKSFQRSKGIGRAVDRLAKEEVELSESHNFTPNVDSHVKSLGHGKIGFVMDQQKDGLIAIHHQDGGKHHVAIFHKDKLVHTSTHPDFETASGQAHTSLTTKKGIKSLSLNEEVEEVDEAIFKLPSSKAGQNYIDKKRAERDAEHKKQDPKMSKMYAKNMVDTDKASKKAAERGIKKDPEDFGWKVRNGVQRGKLPEGVDLDGEHFASQSPKMQDAINLHLRKGKSYQDAVDAAKKHVKEEVQIDETATLNQYIKSLGYDPEHLDTNKKVMYSKTNAFKSYAARQEALYDAGQKGTQDIEAGLSPSATARG